MSKGVFIILLFWGINAFSQSEIILHAIRDYRFSNVVVFAKNYSTKSAYSAYGKLFQNSIENRYLFQAQEYDVDMDLHFFPSRIFSATKKRFFQPDPVSQYFSPFLFVNADPVNIIDMNGNDGKLLYLFDKDLGNDFDNMTIEDRQLIKVLGRKAYFRPLSNFLDGTMTDIPEWNGHVYINGTSYDNGKYSEILKVDKKVMSSPPPIAKSDKYEQMIYHDTENGCYRVYTNSQDIGRQLRAISDDMEVPLKSVTVGGFEGYAAAEQIGKGVRNSTFMRRGLKLAGTKNGVHSLMAQSESSEELRFHMAKGSPIDYLELKDAENGSKRLINPRVYRDETHFFTPRYIEGEAKIHKMMLGNPDPKFNGYIGGFKMMY